MLQMHNFFSGELSMLFKLNQLVKFWFHCPEHTFFKAHRFRWLTIFCRRPARSTSTVAGAASNLKLSSELIQVSLVWFLNCDGPASESWCGLVTWRSSNIKLNSGRLQVELWGFIAHFACNNRDQRLGLQRKTKLQLPVCNLNVAQLYKWQFTFQ